MGVDLDAMRAERAARLDAELARLVSELRAMAATLIVLFGSYAAGRRDLPGRRRASSRWLAGV